MKPLIALVGYTIHPRPDGWPRSDTLVAPASYVRAVHRAGGLEAVLMPEAIDEAGAAQLLERFDGLLLLGGGDVDPAAYGEDAQPESYGVDRERDSFEIALIRAAIRLETPTLAVCRGIQVLNVALGGTLDQHIVGKPGIREHGVPGTRDWSLHAIDLEPESRIARAMGRNLVRSSCHHHQAIGRLSPDLRLVGRAGDGIVEAAEMQNGWVVGVQWHPEDTAAEDPAQQGLFDALVEQARERAVHRSRLQPQTA